MNLLSLAMTECLQVFLNSPKQRQNQRLLLITHL